MTDMKKNLLEGVLAERDDLRRRVTGLLFLLGTTLRILDLLCTREQIAYLSPKERQLLSAARSAARDRTP